MMPRDTHEFETPSPPLTFWDRVFKRDPYESWCGRMPYYVRRSGGSCMGGSRYVHLTPREEYDIANRILRAIEAGRVDFKYATLACVGDIKIFTGQGARFCEIEQPEQVALRKRTQRRVWNALHKARHNIESARASEIKRKLDALV